MKKTDEQLRQEITPSAWGERLEQHNRYLVGNMQNC